MNIKNSRDVTIDVTKGITMILVIICHALGRNYNVIFSFHMPLFFILAGNFVNINNEYSKDFFLKYTKKNFRRLLVPYFFTMGIACLYGLIHAISKEDLGYFMRPFLSTLWLGADTYVTNYGIITANFLWFIIALFWVKEIFYLIQWSYVKITPKYKDVIILGTCILLSFVISLMKNNLRIPALPLSVLQGINALVFYGLGFFIKKYNMPLWIKSFCVLCWFFAICFGRIDMMDCFYKIFPLDILGALGATIMIYYISALMIKICKISSFLYKLIKSLQWIGLNSMLLLCMHDLDFRTGIFWSIKCRIFFLDNLCLTGIDQIIIRLSMAIIYSYLITKIPVIYRIYSAK